MKRQILTVVEGVPGGGKSYCRVRELAEVFLVDDTGPVFTNLPIKISALGEYVERVSGGRVTAADVSRRVELIPEEALKLWRFESGGRSGPWEYFGQMDFGWGHIVLDEAWAYCGTLASTEHIEKWVGFFAELRHRNGTCELLTQSRKDLAPEVMLKAGALVTIVPCEELRDPFLKVPLYTWYQLQAGFFTGKYVPGVEQRLFRKDGDRWTSTKSEIFRLRDEVFALYDSFSAPQAGGDGGDVPLWEFQRLSRLRLLGWAVRNHFDGLVGRPLLAVAVALACWYGPGYLLGVIMKRQGVRAVGSKAPVKKLPVDEAPEVPVIRRPVPSVMQNILPSDDRKLLGVIGQRGVCDDGSDVGVGDYAWGATVDRLDPDYGRVFLSDGRSVGFRRSSVTSVAPPVAASREDREENGRIPEGESERLPGASVDSGRDVGTGGGAVSSGVGVRRPAPGDSSGGGSAL